MVGQTGSIADTFSPEWNEVINVHLEQNTFNRSDLECEAKLITLKVWYLIVSNVFVVYFLCETNSVVFYFALRDKLRFPKTFMGQVALSVDQLFEVCSRMKAPISYLLALTF